MSGQPTGRADVEASSDGVAIRPFTIDVPEEELTDLRSRINATKWPDRETDASQGVQLATIQALARHCGAEYDWRKFEERFKALPHFITEIETESSRCAHFCTLPRAALSLVVSRL